MSATTTEAFLDLVSARRGHFRLESGHHGALWLDLDALFASPRRIQPFVAELAAVIATHQPEAVCGPLLGGAFLAQLVAAALDVAFCFTERVMPPEREGLYPARYRLPPAFRPGVAERRIAIVDDVMSAGSALRGTYAELRAHGARPVVAGALLVLGTGGLDYFAGQGVPVVSCARDEYPLWSPDACPLCEAGEPLEDPSGSAA